MNYLKGVLFVLTGLFFVVNPAVAADSTIVRLIDVSQTSREFPRLVSHLNSSLQKTPAPVIGEIAEKEFGRPDMVRCWLNLDEMWDYRTRKFDFNFKVGVDKYKDVKEKHRETWNTEQESPIHFYEYLKAFSDHSDELMLTIRRYERDILDKSLPVTMEDWKMLFKTGLKHYKVKFPKIKYVEVANEYELKGFMGATDEEYYEFYKRGYEAVNEVNDELHLTGDSRIRVGGPVSTSSFLKRIDRFADFFSQDTHPGKKLDFVSWHEYTIPTVETSFRERQVRDILRKYGLNDQVPLFISEHNPYHYDKDSPERHLSNTAGLVRTLYYSSLYSPNMRIFPWVLYHDANIQTRFMWFSGPNGPQTPAAEIKMLPTGVSMKLLSMHEGREVLVQNQITAPEIVIASATDKKIRVEAVNYAGSRAVLISLDKLADMWGDGTVRIKKYLVDSQHNNLLSNPAYSGRLEVADELRVQMTKGKLLELRQDQLDKDGIVVWELSKAE